MFFHLAAYLKQSYPFFNVAHYVTFRSMAALLSSLTLSLVFGSWFIGKSQNFFSAKTRELTPKNHQEKGSMPTMGGILISAMVIISLLVWADLTCPLVWLFLFCFIGFGCIGAWDDWSKISSKKGINAAVKSRLQILVAFTVTILWIYWCHPSTELYFPFFKNLHPALGLLFIPWVMFVLIGTSNAVNLTDGLDGLAIGALLSNFGVFSIVCYCAGHASLAQYLHIPFAGTAELAVVGGALLGASLGFLWFNTYPAQIFMGDVGSLSLGGGLAFMALAAKQELLLPLAGGLFVIETLSVIAQVASFRYLGKRIFRMAPLHHHFELLGWPESKITIRFCIISFVLSLLTLMSLKLR